jgi:drug/metabolite transporter (DMT)-like permease
VLTLAGGAIVVASALLLTGGWSAILNGGSSRAVSFGLLTGALIGCYTVWDKTIVGVLLVPPLIFNWGNDVGRTLLTTPYALRHWDRVVRTWRQAWREALAVGILGPLSYILVLTALVFSPVSTIAPAREVSIVVGALLGARLLGEPEALRRLLAAALMVIGIVALSLG